MQKPLSIERLENNYKPLLGSQSIRFTSLQENPVENCENIPKRPNSFSGQADELHYEEYLRNFYPEQCDKPLIRESPRIAHSQLYHDFHFQNFFKTSAINIKPNRERQYLQSRERVSRSLKQKIVQLNNYHEVKQNLELFLQDQSWKWVKERPQGFYFCTRQRKTIFDSKQALNNDERRFNNFNTKNFEVKIRVPQIEKYAARKPLLNNMETPLVYYDKIGDVYQKITFGETMQKCLFDYAKSARKAKGTMDVSSDDVLKNGRITRAQVLELVRKQEVMDRNIERMRNRLAINKAYPTPHFEQYMPRTRPSSHQLRWVKTNMNDFEDAIKKNQLDNERIRQNRSRNISPSDWKQSHRHKKSISLSTSPFKINESPPLSRSPEAQNRKQ